MPRPYLALQLTQTMKRTRSTKHCTLLFATLFLCLCGLFTVSHALHAQSQQTLQKVERLAKQLKLSRLQEAQLVAILDAEAPKVEAIKSDSSLTDMQKLEQLKAVHAETDPRVQAILTQQQYEKWQIIRQKELQQTMEKKKTY